MADNTPMLQFWLNYGILPIGHNERVWELLNMM